MTTVSWKLDSDPPITREATVGMSPTKSSFSWSVRSLFSCWRYWSWICWARSGVDLGAQPGVVVAELRVLEHALEEVGDRSR